MWKSTLIIVTKGFVKFISCLYVADKVKVNITYKH